MQGTPIGVIFSRWRRAGGAALSSGELQAQSSRDQGAQGCSNQETRRTAPRTEPYTKAERLASWDVCDATVGEAIDELDVLTPTTGFSWHKPQRSKVEQHISAILHIQHPATQLSGRVRAASGVGADWVGAVAAGSS